MKPVNARSTMKPVMSPSSFAQTIAMSQIGELLIQYLAPLST